MRVLYFHQYFSTRGGAMGTRSYSMAQYLTRLGHQVTMVCLASSNSDTGLRGAPVRGVRHGTVDGFNVIEIAVPYSNYDSLPKRTLTFLRYALQSAWIALTHPCDLVFATSTPLTAGVPGIVARWLRGKPFVFEVRDLWPELPRAMGVVKNPLVLGLMSALEWASYRSANACIGLAPGIVDGIVRRGVIRSRVHMIPNASDLDLFVPRAASTQAPGGPFTAAFTGAHGVANGLDAVLDTAAELLRRRDAQIRIELIGDGKAKPTLQERATSEGITNCVFLEPMPKTDLARRLGEVDVGLMVLANVPAFYYGTSPNKFFDYLAAGLPVVCNYPGWVSDLIREHNCGIAVPPNDPEAFADALQALAARPARCSEMSVNARHLAETLFDRASLANQFCRVLQSAAVT